MKISNLFICSSFRYFVGTAEDKPSTRHLYRVSTNRDTAEDQLQCLTCGTTNGQNAQCTYNDAMFSTRGSYHVRICEGPSVPKAAIVHTKVFFDIFLLINC